jgi:DNA (cytosine-5)-methyltransferase 1
MKIGSLCTGYGGLDMAVEAYFGAYTVWCAEYDKYASELIEENFGYLNHGDISKIDWSSVEPIDILTAGYPCQPFSEAGKRKGVNDERHIWPHITEAIRVLRPKFIVLENVRGHLSLGFDRVLGDLTELGYDARWKVVRASEVGAPHSRARVFIVAYARNQGWTDEWQTQELGRGSASLVDLCMQNPPATLDRDKVNVKFVEYMMGLEPGWVTDMDISLTQKFKMLGNGVVPQQAYYALQQLLDVDTPSEQDLS